MPEYQFGEAVKAFTSPDGKYRLHIVARHDGTFQFIEDVQERDESKTYWFPGYQSGLYESAEHAELEARKYASWLSNQ